MNVAMLPKEGKRMAGSFGSDATHTHLEGWSAGKDVGKAMMHGLGLGSNGGTAIKVTPQSQT